MSSFTEDWHDPFCSFTHVQEVVEKVISRLHGRGLGYDEIIEWVGKRDR